MSMMDKIWVLIMSYHNPSIASSSLEAVQDWVRKKYDNDTTSEFKLVDEDTYEVLWESGVLLGYIRRVPVLTEN